MHQASWLSFAPGAAIFVTVLAFNLLGPGLRRGLDPRLRSSARAESHVSLANCDRRVAWA